MSTIANNLITTKDINITKQIFGPDIGYLKKIRQKPELVVND